MKQMKIIIGFNKEGDAIYCGTANSHITIVGCSGMGKTTLNYILIGVLFSNEVMYWSGYLYRYWHYYTNESSKNIYKIANAGMINDCWLGFHTLDMEMAIEDLKEIYRQKHG